MSYAQGAGIDGNQQAKFSTAQTRVQTSLQPDVDEFLELGLRSNDNDRHDMKRLGKKQEFKVSAVKTGLFWQKRLSSG